MRTVTRRPRSDGRAERDEAIARVAANTPVDWRDDARKTVVSLAQQRADLTTDDVWERLTHRPAEPRALGAVMVWARNYGFITATTEMRESERPEAHRNPKRVWHSNVFGAAPGTPLLETIKSNGWGTPRDVPAPRHTAPDEKSLKRHEPKSRRRGASSKSTESTSTPRPTRTPEEKEARRQARLERDLEQASANARR